jgi:hypothetical protein
MKTECCKGILKTPVIILLLLSNFCLGQGGWMRKYDLGKPGTVVCSVLPDSNFYWVSGVSVDTSQLPQIVVGSFIGRIDQQGNEISHQFYCKQDTSVECWNKTLKKVGNDTIMVMGTSLLFQENYYIGGVLNFQISSSAIGYKLLPIDTFFTFYFPKDNVILNGRNWVSISTTIQGVPTVGNQLLRTNLTAFNQDWTEQQRIIFNGNLDSTARLVFCNLLKSSDTTLFVGYNTYRLGDGPALAKTILKKVDLQGNVLWTYESPVSAKEGVIAHLHQNNDKSIVYAVNAFVDVPSPGGMSYNYRGKVVKIDTLGNRLWERDWGTGQSAYDYVFQAMLVNDDESIITVGSQRVWAIPNDTILPGSRGLITKTSANGDSLWARKFIIRNQTSHWHNFMDIEATNDGGYILCGRSAINGPVFPDEQFTAMAWVVKTDSMGCVVPGCHLVGGEEKTKQRPKVMVYPNPAHDYLAVFVPASTSNQALQVQLINLEGKVVLEDQFTQSDATYLLELKNISAGLYVLKVLQNGDLLQAEKVVVE